MISATSSHVCDWKLLSCGRRALLSRRRYSIQHGRHHQRPLRLAVIGSGPAGFYAAARATSRVDNALVDMYEKLPVPFGLVRFGVAPDHPEVKNCQDKFTSVARSSRFRFVGNIAVGLDLPLQALKPHYDAILFAYGASKDRTLDIPGESSLKGIYSARAFVGWYDGLPQYADLEPDLTAGEDAVIIGQGNVSLDVARMLLTDVDVLRKTDMPAHALETISKSRVRRVKIVGRRGPMQAAFTVREVRELIDLPLVGHHPVDPLYLPSDLSKLTRPRKRLAQVLQKQSAMPLSAASKQSQFLFFRSPISFDSSSKSPDQLSHTTFEKTTIERGLDPFDQQTRVRSTGERSQLPASVAFRSIGYKSEPLPGLEELGIPFDHQRGIIPNDLHGRVLAPSKGPGDLTAGHVPGVYVAGWAKRGPTGVIATTMEDAFATAEVIVQDWHDHSMFLNGEPERTPELAGWDGVKAEADRRGLRRVSWSDWETIDAAERERGRTLGKEREKFSSIEDMLAVLDSP